MSSFVRFYRETTAETWAKSTLTPEEYVAFCQALDENTQLWQSYTDQGLITTSPIWEDVYQPGLDATAQIKVGEKIELAPGVSMSQLTLSPAWGYWLARYNNEAGPDFIEVVTNIT